MRRLLTAAAIAAGALELWRSGYVAPLLYGVRQWIAARPDPRNQELDVLA